MEKASPRLMDAKMRAMSLTRLQRWPGTTSLWIRNGFHSTGPWISAPELRPRKGLCKFAAAHGRRTGTWAFWRCLAGVSAARFVRRDVLHRRFIARVDFYGVGSSLCASYSRHAWPDLQISRRSHATGMGGRRCMLACNHINKGGSRDPFLA